MSVVNFIGKKFFDTNNHGSRLPKPTATLPVNRQEQEYDMITFIGPNGIAKPITITEAATRCEEAFQEMARDGQRLSFAKNPKAIVFHPYFLINRHAPGPATVCIGSTEEIADLAMRIDGLLIAEQYLGIFEP